MWGEWVRQGDPGGSASGRGLYDLTFRTLRFVGLSKTSKDSGRCGTLGGYV